MKMNRPSAIRHGALAAILLVAMVLLLTIAPGFAQSDTAQANATPASSVYVVRPGDGWGIIAQRLGTTILELKKLNPQAVRYGDILQVGEQLQVPYQTPVPIATEYIVRPGDGWGIIAQRVGVTMKELMDANPQYIRYGLILRTGDRLAVPALGNAAAIANANANVTVNADAAANTAAQSQAAVAAPPLPTDTPVATPTPAPTDTPVATETATAISEAATPTEATSATGTTADTAAGSATITGTDATSATTDSTVSGSDVQTDTASSESAAISETTASGESSLPVTGCPVAFDDYTALIVAKANEGNDLTALQTYLSDCGALQPESFVSQEWTADGIPDLVLVYENPVPSATVTETELLILNSSPTGYQIGYQAHPSGAARLLATFDINEDGKSDIVWSDTNCGASTCFVTVNVQSWDGTAWQNWTAENITHPESEVTLEDRTPEGQGLEIVMNGGTYGNVGAGPQRGSVKSWASINGEPYTSFDVLYNASPCLYHAVLDANTAYDKATEPGYAEAEKLYQQAFSDTNLKPCWTRPNEEAELRSFSLFRLALVAAQMGRTQEASDLIQSLNTLYPDSPVTPAANVWLSTMTETGNLEGACAKVNEYATENQQVVDILADYGYANPTFTAKELCLQPVVEESNTASETDASAADASAVTTETVAAETVAAEAVSGSSTVTDTGTATDTATADTATTAISGTTDSGAADSGAPAPAAETSTTVDNSATVSATTETASTDQTGTNQTGTGTDLSCPSDLKGLSNALPALLTDVKGESQPILNYLKGCNAADEQNGAVAIGDFNDDSFDDVLVLPSIRSDLGFGPNGTQGAVLLYHGAADKSYTLAYNPEIYGGTDLLADEDLNGDGKVDLAWTVTGCTTSCLTEVQMVSWSAANDNYESIIRPGALIAEGKVELAPVPPSDPGKGRQLVLSGGVSTLPDSGLPVPHTEIWESVQGAPFQRIHWTYDRKTEGNDCLGLRLVEAEMAMQAATVLSYTTAIDLYQSALDDTTLKACSIHKLDAATEMALLQGLGQFRLVQALALNGNSEGAEIALAALNKSSANEDYKQIAATWLKNYTSSQRADSACSAVQPLIDAKSELWQITDHFGFNHSVAGQQKICFIPEETR